MNGIIEVSKGKPTDIKLAIQAYEKISSASPKRNYTIKIVDHGIEGSLVILPADIHPYYFSNLINWLNKSPGSETVEKAEGWLCKLDTTYYLFPDAQNQYGDTLMGRSSSGEPIVVSLPDLLLARTERELPEFKIEPEIPASKLEDAISINLEFEDLSNTMNPNFEFTHRTGELDSKGKGKIGYLPLIVVAIGVYAIFRFFHK